MQDVGAQRIVLDGLERHFFVQFALQHEVRQAFTDRQADLLGAQRNVHVAALSAVYHGWNPASLSESATFSGPFFGS